MASPTCFHRAIAGARDIVIPATAAKIVRFRFVGFSFRVMFGPPNIPR